MTTAPSARFPWRRWVAPTLAAGLLFVVLRALQFEMAELRVHDILAVRLRLWSAWGLTSAEGARVGALLNVIPLGAVELSHFAGSVAGTGLLVLGWALTRWLDVAYHLARLLLVVGIAASLLKGLDIAEAVLPLAGFSFEGGARRGLRRTPRELQKAGARFEVVHAANVGARWPSPTSGRATATNSPPT